MSERLVRSTGALQGTVLSPFLFTLHTSDFQYNSEPCQLQTDNNHFLLNVAKTKEMVVDFRRTGTKLNTISILREEMEVMVG